MRLFHYIPLSELKVVGPMLTCVVRSYMSKARRQKMSSEQPPTRHNACQINSLMGRTGAGANAYNS